MQVNSEFAPQVEKLEGIAKDTPLFFLCRSGGRSHDAAVEMAKHGYTQCYNIIDGFEGEPDATGHRGMTNGWKQANLPWEQN